jgi:hypothetical protein
MWRMASQLDDETIKGIASYYASQATWPTSKNPNAALLLGKEIYERAVAVNDVPASTERLRKGTQLSFGSPGSIQSTWRNCLASSRQSSAGTIP